MDDRTTYPDTSDRRVVDTPATTTPLDDMRTTGYAAPTTTVTERREVGLRESEPPVGERRFSIGATFLGWAVASFFSLVFLAIVAGFLGGSAIDQYYSGDTTLDAADVNAYGIGALVGIVAATFLAFLIGGYAAGRISLWDGTMHGALIVVWPVLFAILGFILGAAIGDDLAAATGINFSVQNLDTLTSGAILGVLATLLAMLAGGALGGRFGERYHKSGYDASNRRAYARGRTF